MLLVLVGTTVTDVCRRSHTLGNEIDTVLASTFVAFIPSMIKCANYDPLVVDLHLEFVSVPLINLIEIKLKKNGWGASWNGEGSLHALVVIGFGVSSKELGES